MLISACLSGDGAGAAVLSGEPIPDTRRIEWKTAGTILTTADRDSLRFEHRGGMLRNILTPEVPALASGAARRVLSTVLKRANVSRAQISAWIMHAGGREILLAIQAGLDLTPDDLHWSADILREYGNVSSPCVYFVLQRALADRAPGGLWWMSSFGAGFSCHGALLEVT